MGGNEGVGCSEWAGCVYPESSLSANTELDLPLQLPLSQPSIELLYCIIYVMCVWVLCSTLLNEHNVDALLWLIM